jgi:hypothetical protein
MLGAGLLPWCWSLDVLLFFISRHLENTFLVFVSSLNLHTLKGNVPTNRQFVTNVAVNTCHSTNIVVEYCSVVDPDPDPGSGSVLDPYSIGPLDPDPDP